jgi:hypothetical protein
MYRVAVRDPADEVQDIASRLAEFSTGHCGRQIELPPEQVSVSSSTSPSETCLDMDQNSAEDNATSPDQVNAVVIVSSPAVPERVNIHIV